MKKIILTSILITLLSSFTCFAQRSVPTEFRAGYNTMMANQFRSFNDMNRNMMNMMMMNKWYASNPDVNNKYNYDVLMKDSTMRKIKSKIFYDTVLHKSYLTYDDKTIKGNKKEREKKIYCTETLSIGRPDAYGKVDGMPTDSCWLFKVVTGKINAYSPFSELYDLEYGRLTAYQMADGPVIKLDSAALAPLVAKSRDAMKAFKKKNFYKAINKYNSDKNIK